MNDLPQEAQNVEPALPQDENIPASETASQEAQEQSNDPARRPSADDQDRNWKAMREGTEEKERRNQELMRQNAELTSMVKEFVDSTKPPRAPEVEDDDSDILTLGQTKKVFNRDGKKIARREIEEYMAERDNIEAPFKLKEKFKDFDSVVSVKNVDYLKKNEPEMAAILRDAKSAYSQGAVAYKFIKSLGIAESDSVNDMMRDASNNAEKPVSPNAIAGRNSVGDANKFDRGLTKELKAQLHQEMLDVINRG